MSYKFFIFLMLFLFPIVNAVTTGNVSLTTTQNASIVTGVWGSSYNFYCNANGTCIPGDKCILDYDGTSSGSNQGWCTASSETRCRHDDTFYTSGNKICTDSNSKARTCVSGAWTTATCNSTQTCSSGDCVASSGSTSGSSSGSGSSSNATAPAKKSELSITAVPDNFDIVQGNSVLKQVTVKNTGNISLPTVSLAVSGIDGSTVTPASTNISKDLSVTFTINFTVPENAEVKEYEVTATAKNESVSASRTFKIRVLPSNKTVESNLIPLYNQYVSLISQLESNISDLASKGANVTELRNILNSIKDKLSQTNSSLSSQDYFKANALLNETKQLISQLQEKISTTKPQEFKIDLIYIIIPVIIGVAAVLAYLFWPTRK